MQGYFLPAVDLLRNIHVDTGINVVELRADQRIESDGAHAWLKASCRIGDTVTDLQGGLVIGDGPHLRLLDDACRAFVHESLQKGAGNNRREITQAEAAELVQRNVAAPGTCACSRAAARTRSTSSASAGPGSRAGASSVARVTGRCAVHDGHVNSRRPS